jgi:uncharacterized membrane protein
MKTASTHLLRTFVTGALAALPLAATVFVFWWAVSLLWRWLGPGSAVGSVLSGIGLGVSGSEFVGYLMGLAIVTLAILLLGVFIERAVGRSVARLVDRLLRRIPIVRTVWDLAQRLVGLLQQGQAGQVEGAEPGARSMTPVWCHFGGAGGAAALALLSSSEPVLGVGERARRPAAARDRGPAADRRGHHQPRAHRGEDRAALRGPGGLRARRLAQRGRVLGPAQ